MTWTLIEAILKTTCFILFGICAFQQVSVVYAICSALWFVMAVLAWWQYYQDNHRKPRF